MDEPGFDVRKRRRITPINFTTAPLIETAEAQFTGPSHVPSTALPDQPGIWDYLAKWDAIDDTVIGDGEEEEYFSDGSNGSLAAIEIAEHEIEEGVDLTGHPVTRPSKMGTEKVTKIINDCIEMYTKAWEPGKGETKHRDETGQTDVPVTYDTIALWEQAEAAGKREELAEKYELEAEYYRQRLDKLCEAILKDPGDTVAGIQMKCRNLEVTVELLERASWLGDIYKLPPDVSSDDEAQDGTSVLAAVMQPTTSPSVGHFQQYDRNVGSQIFDLGTPSDSEDDSMPLDDMSTTPAHFDTNNNQKRTHLTYRLASTQAMVVSAETSDPALIVTSPLIMHSQLPLDDAPEHASIASVSRWSWSQLEETHDRKRIVSKAVHELASKDREIIRQRLQQAGRVNVVREIPACVEMLWRGDQKMPGILPQDLPKIVNFTRLFLCWWLCGNYFQREASEADLLELRDCLRDRSADPATFCDYVGTILSTTFSHAALDCPTKPSQAEIIVISDDDDEPPPKLPKRLKSNIGKS